MSEPSKVIQQEEETLARWEREKIFETAVGREAPKGDFVFYEGPPTANGKPGIHHVLARAFKDVIPRYKTMCGFRVARKAGWDTHGLPVELEVEKKLGLKGKQDIEHLKSTPEESIAHFNELCRQSVWTYKEEWERLTKRIAFWLDFEHTYITYDPKYIESLWAILRRCWDQGLLFEDYKIVPYCPRCGTPLSSHELAQGYDETEDPSIIVKFLIRHRAGTDARGDLPDNERLPRSIGSLAMTEERTRNDNTSLLVWTTTPWTLPANVALAVKEDATYVRVCLLRHRAGTDVRGDLLENERLPRSIGSLAMTEEGTRYDMRENLILAKDRLSVLQSEYEILEEIPGSALVGLRYQPLYDQRNAVDSSTRAGMTNPAVDAGSGAQMTELWYQIRAADFVSMNDGTGIVHIAPAYGADDFDLCRQNGIAPLFTVDTAGKVIADVSGKGLFVKKADQVIMDDLASRGLLFDHGTITHTYPFCWRCATPLLYMARPSWYLRTTAIRDRMIAANQTINWVPEHTRDGRFGEWLREVKDWAITRERYWGTPLPIWVCEQCKKKHCIGSFAELTEGHHEETGADVVIPNEHAGVDGIATSPAMAPRNDKQGGDTLFNPHRPYIDAVKLKCECGGVMTRVKDLVDVWFDSGAMPFAQHHWPFSAEGGSASGGDPPIPYPADYISEAIDQTRGWFYTLLAVGCLLGKGAPYRNVICLGHVVDAKGQKMSKSRGNIVNPWDIIEKYGADALRWFYFIVNQPGDTKRFDEREFRERVSVLTTYRNVVSFYQLHGCDASVIPARERESTAVDSVVSGPRMTQNGNVLDRWILIRLNQTIRAMTTHLDAYEIVEAARTLEILILDVSMWWLRRSRERLKVADVAARDTLHLVLTETAKLFAPFTPFLAEEIWTTLGNEESVHLALWPKAENISDPSLVAAMNDVRTIASALLEARTRAKIPVRQPLACAKIMHASRQLASEFIEILQDEANIATVSLEVSEGELVVELDTNLTPELKAAGMLRELARQINDLRKEAGLSPSDQAHVILDAPAESVIDLDQLGIATHCIIVQGPITDGREIVLNGQIWKLKIEN